MADKKHPQPKPKQETKPRVEYLQFPNADQFRRDVANYISPKKK